MSYFVVDVESDGPIQGIHSMVCFGSVMIEPKLKKTFYGQVKPISDKYIESSLKISGFSREDHLKFKEPVIVMHEFAEFIMTNSIGQPILISDNNGYDAAWINYYFHRFYGTNPFGWSSRRIGDLYCGFVNDTKANWKHLRKTKHTHHPVDDALGNAEALLEMQKMGLKIKF
jgi:hypothetical protein